MSSSRRSRSAPCFCGSGRAFKHCCLRAMAQAQMIRQEDSTCRWRIWRVYGPGASKFATREVAEHLCDGEFLWIAPETVDRTTWMIDDYPVGLMEVIDHVPPAMAEWVVDQTMAALGGVIAELVGLEAGDEGTRRVEPNDQEDQLANMAVLMMEFMQFAHAGAVVTDKLESLYELVERERAGQAGARSAAA